MTAKEDVISVILEFSEEEYPIEPLEKRISELDEEITLLYNMLSAFIAENAQNASDQDEYTRKYARYAERFESLKKERDQEGDRLTDMRAQKLKIEHFVRRLEQQVVFVETFDAELWYATIDWMEITKEQDVDVVFKGGYTIRVSLPGKHERKYSA